MLQELIRETAKDEFKVGTVYHPLGDFLTLFTQDAECYGEQVNDTLTLYRDDKSNEVVGFKLKKVSTLIEEAPVVVDGR